MFFCHFLIVFYRDFTVTSNILIVLAVGCLSRIIIRLIFSIYHDVSLISGVEMVSKLAITTLVSYLVQLLVAYFFLNETETMAISNIFIIPLLTLSETLLLIIYRYWRRILNLITKKQIRIKTRTLIIGTWPPPKLFLMKS